MIEIVVGDFANSATACLMHLLGGSMKRLIAENIYSHFEQAAVERWPKLPSKAISEFGGWKS